jgi:hypothetical protein
MYKEIDHYKKYSLSLYNKHSLICHLESIPYWSG